MKQHSSRFTAGIGSLTYKALSILTGGRKAGHSFQTTVMPNVAIGALADDTVDAVSAGASVPTRVGATSIKVYLTIRALQIAW